MDKLFKSVFNNIVLSRIIFHHVRLYKKNKFIKIYSRKELLEYKEREYIEIIEYDCSQMLEVGDLPIGCVLKGVYFNDDALSLIKGDAIPYGVEIIGFNWNNDDELPTTEFSSLPSTVHTINNASISSILPITVSSPCYTIPANITSISFNYCPNISNDNYYGNGYMIIPNTIKYLDFGEDWDNQYVKLRKGDIPDSVTYLSMTGYRDIHKLVEGILPNSIKHLNITIHHDNTLFNFIPQSVELLEVNFEVNLTPALNLVSCTSITELILKNIRNRIEINTIPNSVTNLILSFSGEENNTSCINNLISKSAIPTSVKSLIINRIIDDGGILPSSLTSLNLSITKGNSTIITHKLNKMLSILPQSLISIKLPKQIK